jgi:hypothetical protein
MTTVSTEDPAGSTPLEHATVTTARPTRTRRPTAAPLVLHRAPRRRERGMRNDTLAGAHGGSTPSRTLVRQQRNVCGCGCLPND